MIRCVGNIREADGRYFITCRGREGYLNTFYYKRDPPVERTFVEDWIKGNCQHPAEIYGSSSVVFADEGDAALFWMTFRKDRVE